MNPRGESTQGRVRTSDDFEEERSRRIVRRSIPYGGPADPQNPPSSGLGLLFLCFQSNISRQFAFLQRIWANDPDFAIPSTGIDPLIGKHQPRPLSTSGPGQGWPTRWDSARGRGFRFQDFVRLRGGEFFFAPSIPFLLGR